MRGNESEHSEHAGDLLSRAESLLDEAKEILSTAKKAKNLTAATAAVNACTRLLELCGRASGELQSANARGIHLTMNSTKVTINNYDDDLAAHRRELRSRQFCD